MSIPRFISKYFNEKSSDVARKANKVKGYDKENDKNKGNTISTAKSTEEE